MGMVRLFFHLNRAFRLLFEFEYTKDLMRLSSYHQNRGTNPYFVRATTAAAATLRQFGGVANATTIAVASVQVQPIGVIVATSSSSTASIPTTTTTIPTIPMSPTPFTNLSDMGGSNPSSCSST